MSIPPPATGRAALLARCLISCYRRSLRPSELSFLIFVLCCRRLRPNPTVGDAPTAPSASGRAQLLATLKVKAAQEAPTQAEGTWQGSFLNSQHFPMPQISMYVLMRTLLGRAALLSRLKLARSAPGSHLAESSGYSAPSRLRIYIY